MGPGSAPSDSQINHPRSNSVLGDWHESLRETCGRLCGWPMWPTFSLMWAWGETLGQGQFLWTWGTCRVLPRLRGHKRAIWQGTLIDTRLWGTTSGGSYCSLQVPWGGGRQRWGDRKSPGERVQDRGRREDWAEGEQNECNGSGTADSTRSSEQQPLSESALKAGVSFPAALDIPTETPKKKKKEDTPRSPISPQVQSLGVTPSLLVGSPRTPVVISS